MMNGFPGMFPQMRPQLGGMHYIGGTAYFDPHQLNAQVNDVGHLHQHQHQHQHQHHHHPVPMKPLGSELDVDLPVSGTFSSVDCKWKEVIRIPTESIQEVTKACLMQRHVMGRGDRGKKGQAHPNICEDFHAGSCPNGQHCKLFHLRRDWLDEHRKPHQDALEQAREEFHRIQREKKCFTVFCPNLKETLPVPAAFMHFTRGLFLREEERAKRQAQHGGKHTESHQNPSVCQLFIKGGGERQCKWGELCNQAHPHRDWLQQRHEMSVKYVQQCKKEFEQAAEGASWDALDPDTNERVTIPKAFLKFTRGLYAKEYAGSRLASICMLHLKRFDVAQDGNGCTAGDLCNQVHVDLDWILKHRIEFRIRNGEYDSMRHRVDYYHGVHYPAGRRGKAGVRGTPSTQGQPTPPSTGLPVAGKWWLPSSPASSMSSVTVGHSVTSSPAMLPTALPTCTGEVMGAMLPTPDHNPLGVLGVDVMRHKLQTGTVNAPPLPPPSAKSSVDFSDDLMSNVAKLIDTEVPAAGGEEKNVIEWFRGVADRQEVPPPPPPPQQQPQPQPQPQPPSPPPAVVSDDDDDDEEEHVVLGRPIFTPPEQQQRHRQPPLQPEEEDDDDAEEVVVVREQLAEQHSPIHRKMPPTVPLNTSAVPLHTSAAPGVHHAAPQAGNNEFSPFGIESLTALMEDLDDVGE